MKDTLFSFRFYVVDFDITIEKLFTIKGINTQDIENDKDVNFSNFVVATEDLYGEHDLCKYLIYGNEHGKIVDIGFKSNEIKLSDHDELMERWRKYFIDLGGIVSRVYYPLEFITKE